MALAPPAAWSQPQPPPTSSEALPPAVGLPQPFPLVFGIFDLSGVHTFPATVAGTAGTMGSTFLTGRIAPVIRVNPKLYLSVPLDGSISSYDFHGDPGLLPTRPAAPPGTRSAPTPWASKAATRSTITGSCSGRSTWRRPEPGAPPSRTP